ncbi:MAG: VOC family protein [Chloroflexi bacterium]|nr:VOC family protein [Chloroflexota bacterium]MBV9133990.1 VOC family protein [Chloroflexota bacterium]MBV9898779.1 VOC family protein [Chloroflexota bacterium]
MTTAPTRGVEGILVETHNWGKSVAFWKALGYELEFETDHHSGQLRHPGGGPYLFVAEVPESVPVAFLPMLSADSTEQFQPPSAGTVEQPFVEQHWGVHEMMLRDPDNRRVSVQVPIRSETPTS